MKGYMGLYRNRTVRKRGHAYAGPGCYLVSICTANRAPVFGTVVGGRMQLSAAGRVVNEEWDHTAELRPNVRLETRVIMPDHFQAIISILARPSQSDRDASAALANDSLGEIIGRFKAACTRRIRETMPGFAWQDGFHDRILRSRTALGFARRYLRRNPREWEENAGRRRGRSVHRRHSPACLMVRPGRKRMTPST